MIENIVESIGLGIIGIDPITAAYLVSMGTYRERKKNISCFMFSFVFFSTVPAAIISSVFGEIAVNYIKSIGTENKNIFRLLVEILIVIALFTWIYKKSSGKSSKSRNKQLQEYGGLIKHIFMGFIFAIAAYTDPTYYAVILIGGKNSSFIASLLLLFLWLLVSQLPAFAVYGAVLLNLNDKMNSFIGKIKSDYLKKFSRFIQGVFLIIELFLICDIGCCLFKGNFLF